MYENSRSLTDAIGTIRQKGIKHYEDDGHYDRDYIKNDSKKLETACNSCDLEVLSNQYRGDRLQSDIDIMKNAFNGAYDIGLLQAVPGSALARLGSNLVFDFSKSSAGGAYNAASMTTTKVLTSLNPFSWGRSLVNYKPTFSYNQRRLNVNS